MQQPLWGLYGRASVAHADRVKASGANALWFHGFDADAFEACARADLAPCVEVKTFRADFAKRPDLVPIGVDGKPIRYGAPRAGGLPEPRLLHGGDRDEPRLGARLLRAGGRVARLPDLRRLVRDAGARPAGELLLRRLHRRSSSRPPESTPGPPRRSWAGTRSPGPTTSAGASPGWRRRYADLIRARRPGCVVGAYMCPWMPGEHGRRPAPHLRAGLRPARAGHRRVHAAHLRGQVRPSARVGRRVPGPLRHLCPRGLQGAADPRRPRFPRVDGSGRRLARPLVGAADVRRRLSL